MLYIAYGSNISEKRMHLRCPSARFITKGYLEDMVLWFHYYANIERAHDYFVPAVLWDIPESEVAALDFAEGFPTHYTKKQLVICLEEPDLNAEEITAKMIAMVGADNINQARGFIDHQNGILGTAYVMTDWKKNEWEKHDWQTPIDYVEHILAGYKEQCFDGWYLHDLWYALYRGEKRPESRT